MRLRSREAVLREVWLPLEWDWERITVEPGELIALPAGVLALVRYRGVRRGTGAPRDAQAAHIWDVHGDRITRYRGLADTYALHYALSGRLRLVLGDRDVVLHRSTTATRSAGPSRR